jgi:hypothetical protein
MPFHVALHGGTATRQNLRFGKLFRGVPLSGQRNADPEFV